MRPRSQQPQPGQGSLQRKLAWVVVAAICAASMVLLLGQLERLERSSSDRLVNIYRVHGCRCAFAWERVLKQGGFEVRMREVDTLQYVRARLRTPPQLKGCHVAKYLNYFIEGHVEPTALRTLRETSPVALGVAAMQDDLSHQDHEVQSKRSALVVFDKDNRPIPWRQMSNLRIGRI